MTAIKLIKQLPGGYKGRWKQMNGLEKPLETVKTRNEAETAGQVLPPPAAAAGAQGDRGDPHHREGMGAAGDV